MCLFVSAHSLHLLCSNPESLPCGLLTVSAYKLFDLHVFSKFLHIIFQVICLSNCFLRSVHFLSLKGMRVTLGFLWHQCLCTVTLTSLTGSNGKSVYRAPLINLRLYPNDFLHPAYSLNPSSLSSKYMHSQLKVSISPRKNS